MNKKSSKRRNKYLLIITFQLLLDWQKLEKDKVSLKDK